MARYHTPPGASLTQPNFLSFGSSNRGYELLLEQARVELSQEWDMAIGDVDHHGPPPAQTYYLAREYCNLFDVT